MNQNFKTLKMKHTLTLLLLFLASCVMAQQRVTFHFSDGLQDETLKSLMEGEISKLLTEINRAATANRPLQLRSIKMTQEARTALQNRWNRSSHFRCWDEENVQRCLTDYSGYEVRDITITMLNPNIKGDRTRELCIGFSRQGTITDVHPQIAEYTYQQVMGNSQNVEDLKRKTEILKWVEQFRSYYDEKDVASLEKVFSDKALIITGRVINTKAHTSDMAALKQEVVYSRQTKQEYIDRLAAAFRKNSFIKLSFSDIKIGRHGSKENIFWVGLKQKWESQHYGDEGYLFLVWEFPEDGGDPLIHVRTWQPDEPQRRLEDNEKFNINDFFIP